MAEQILYRQAFEISVATKFRAVALLLKNIENSLSYFTVAISTSEDYEVCSK